MTSAPRSVFITGASSGLGAAVARHLAKAGWHVGLAARTVASLDLLAAELKQAARKAEVFALDVADAPAVDAAIRSFKPDALVCCAGMLGRGDATGELTPELFARVMAVNVAGTFHACRSAMSLWKQGGVQGDIVNISSLGGIRGMQRFTGFGAYATSKHAIIGLTEALALEGKALGIRVNAVAPGTMRTAMTEALGMQPATLPGSIAPTIEFLLDRARSGPVTGTTMEVHCNDD